MFFNPYSSKNETFGTDIRDNIYKMNYNPGPGSYNVQSGRGFSYSIGDARRKGFG